MTALTKRGLPRKRVGHNAPASERILLHTDRTGDHWLWTGSVDKQSGYGRMSIGGRSAYSHRVSYEAFVGPIPDGLQIDHLCRVRACCRPDHLEPVTARENVLRAPSGHASVTNCPYGHPYDEANTYRTGGRRYCLTCRTAYVALWKAVPYAEAMRRKRLGIPVVDLAAYFAEQSREDAA